MKSICSIAAWTVAAVLVAPPVIAQERDEEYTAKILEYTTEPFFLTPYVDHLPASATVPTPLEVLGHIVGAPDVLSYPAEVYEYMRAVAEAAARKAFVGTRAAEALALASFQLLGTPHTDPHELRLVQAAVRYFILEEDADSDLDSPNGFDDDIAVINAVLCHLNHADWVVNKPAG